MKDMANIKATCKECRDRNFYTLLFVMWGVITAALAGFTAADLQKDNIRKDVIKELTEKYRMVRK